MCTREQFEAARATLETGEADENRATHANRETGARPSPSSPTNGSSPPSRCPPPKGSPPGTTSSPATTGRAITASRLGCSRSTTGRSTRPVSPRHRDGGELPLDALAFITELRGTLGLGEQILPVYLEKISSTLASTAFKLARTPVSAGRLARSGFQEIEAGMTEGPAASSPSTARTRPKPAPPYG